MKEHDSYCPLMGSQSLNYWKDKCEQRQKNPAMKDTCYPECKMIKRTYAGGPNNGNRKRAIKLLDEGLTVKEVAHKLGISKSTVHGYVHKLKKDQK